MATSTATSTSKHLARVGIEIAWTELRNHPIERGPDPDAINEAAGRFELLSAMLTELEAELVAIDTRQAELDRQRKWLTAAELETAVLESNTLVFRLARLQRDLAATRQRRERTRTDLEQAMSDQTQIGRHDATYAERLTCALARVTHALASTSRTFTGQLSVKEVAEILGVTKQTIGRWIRNSFATPHWTPGAWTRTPTGSWTIATVELSRDALTEIQQDKLLVTLLRRDHSLNLRERVA